MGYLLTTALLLQSVLSAFVTEPLQHVDPLIGSANGGDVFPGATLPYGMAKAVADTDSKYDQGGFTFDGANITGFSSLHDSGTGGSPSLGNFALFPHSSCVNDTVDGCVFPKLARKTQFFNSSLQAVPGRFSLTLDSGVNVAMTTAQHTSLFHFTFPRSGSGSPLILMDLTDLSDSRQDNASIAVDAKSGRMIGQGVFKPSFGSGTYIAYFCVDFSGSSVRDNGIFVNTRASASVKELKLSRGINSLPLPGGAFVRFNSQKSVLARQGLSFVSYEHACNLAEAEISTFDFNATYQAAKTAWKEKLDVIKVDTQGVQSSILKNFYSGIYRTMINPQDYTGVQPLIAKNLIWFDSFYCLWDSFRSQIPFLTVIDTTSVEKMIKGLLNIYTYQGWLPDCHMSLCKGFTQGGSNADNIISDGFLKLKNTTIDWNKAYEAVVKDAEVEPYDWSSEGRGGLDSWHSLGFIPAEDFDYKGHGTMTRSISRTLEYSYNDFCIAQLAKGLGKQGDAEKYRSRSDNWVNLYNSEQASSNNGSNTGFVGFFQPRYLNQTWGFQDPLYCSNIDTNPNSICSLQYNAGETFESSIWEYSFFVPHDQARLISMFGGPQAFVRRLDYLHDNNITYIGNEPAFLTVFQYHYAGRPALSAKRSHFYIPRYFQPTPDGLPGNDDSGAMGSFVAFAMMGLFPNPGQDVYLITPPYFAAVNITSPVTGKVARIRNEGFDPSYADVYIQRATLDGKPYTRNWIDHSFFTDGKELVLDLGRNESAWGTQRADLPPSLSGYQGY